MQAKQRKILKNSLMLLPWGHKTLIFYSMVPPSGGIY